MTISTALRFSFGASLAFLFLIAGGAHAYAASVAIQGMTPTGAISASTTVSFYAAGPALSTPRIP